jgi:hypothetical protein
MSTLRTGDDTLHYSDNSHRWIAPPDMQQDLWEMKLRAHMDRHLMTMGRPVSLDYFRDYWTPHPPPARPRAGKTRPRRAGTRTARG